MAVAPQRSCNDELEAGMSDGTYKKVIKDRGGFPEAITAQVRREFDDIWYGIHEVNPKTMPDGLVANTIDYVETNPAKQV